MSSIQASNVFFFKDDYEWERRQREETLCGYHSQEKVGVNTRADGVRMLVVLPHQ